MRRISLASGVLPEFSGDVVADAAVRSGYSDAGLMVRAGEWTDETTEAIAARLDGIGVLDVEVIWIPATGEVDDDMRRLIEIGGRLGAANVLIVSSADVATTKRAFGELCELAAGQRMRAVLEFLMISEIKSLATALEIVTDVAHPAGGVLIDTLHLARSGEPPGMIADVDPELLPYVQLCDGPLVCANDYDSLLADALDARSAAGEGELPLAEVLACLDGEVPLSLEVRSKGYRERYPDPVERATAVLEQTRTFLESLD